MTLPHAWGPGEIVGGHRLLRRLGSGETAEVWLAAPALAEDAERVALKLIRPGAGIERAGREAEALWRARGPHVVRLRDVVPLASGTSFLILDAVPHELPTVLSRGLRPGAAVTVLVPIAQEVSRLHSLGVAHGGLRLGAIGLDRRGSPVLLGFGAAVTGRVSAAAREADLVALAALALVVLSAVDEGERDDEWHRLVAWLGASRAASEEWLAECIERCYRLAEPEPVALDSVESLSDVVQAAAGSAFGSQPTAAEPSQPGVIGRMRALVERFGSSRAAPPGAQVARTAPLAPAAADSARAHLPRPRFWVPAVVAAAGLLAVLLVPVAGAADAAESPIAPGATRTPSPIGQPGVRALPSTGPSPEASGPSSGPPDPVPGVAVPRAAPEPVPTASVVDELGGAFIVELDGPRGLEQLVLVDGPDGWEVREYLAADAAEDPEPSGPQTPRTPAKSAASSRDFTAERKRAASAPSMIR